MANQRSRTGPATREAEPAVEPVAQHRAEPRRRSGPWRGWLRPEFALGLLVLAGGLVETVTSPDAPWAAVARVALLSASVALLRWRPGLALTLSWAALGVQLIGGADFALIDAAVAFTAYGCARYGSRSVLWLSGASIPAASAVALLQLLDRGTHLDERWSNAIAPGGTETFLGACLLGLLILVVPWLLGLSLRLRGAAQTAAADRRRAERERDEAALATAHAEQISTLREAQATLANDVHDIVGHSLAVILAQAQSGAFVDDIGHLHGILADVATTARTSLGEVRRVLSATKTATPPPPPGPLTELTDAVAGAAEITVREHGIPRTLDATIHVVAYRVLQEMLTNAIKHQTAGGTIAVELDWGDGLRLSTSNAADLTDDSRSEGLGLASMRRRVELVGGTLEHHVADGRFTTSAWLPTATDPHVEGAPS